MAWLRTGAPSPCYPPPIFFATHPVKEQAMITAMLHSTCDPKKWVGFSLKSWGIPTPLSQHPRHFFRTSFSSRCWHVTEQVPWDLDNCRLPQLTAAQRNRDPAAAASATQQPDIARAWPGALHPSWPGGSCLCKHRLPKTSRVQLGSTRA